MSDYVMRWNFGVSLPSHAGIVNYGIPWQTSRCYWCGRFRRDSQRPRHICPSAKRRRRVMRAIRHAIAAPASPA